MRFLTAPTDGDIAVWLPSANVLVMGDLLVNGGYPVIEESSRGSLRGMINALERLSRIVNADTVVVPGHGAIGDRRTLFAFADLLRVIEERVQSLLASHSTSAEIIAALPLPANLTWHGAAVTSPETSSSAWSLRDLVWQQR